MVELTMQVPDEWQDEFNRLTVIELSLIGFKTLTAAETIQFLSKNPERYLTITDRRGFNACSH